MHEDIVQRLGKYAGIVDIIIFAVCCTTKTVHELCANDAPSYLGLIDCVRDEPWK
jgi:hypothetical protein